LAEAGVKVHHLAEEAEKRNFSGIEFFYGLPGTVGGAIYMNARCYGVSTSDVLETVTFLDRNLDIKHLHPEDADFSYKQTPFQHNRGVILSGEFRIARGDSRSIREKMDSYMQDRTRKGHFSFPSVGSVFKNDRRFGEPSGKIIDSLDLRGYRIGRAMISKDHANIIVNTGGATAQDVRELIEYIKQKVRDTYGFTLEEEVRYIGEW
jgi:UDP-N-acetylmuramate dehydrogenase